MDTFFVLGADARFDRVAEILAGRGRVYRSVSFAGEGRNIFLFPFSAPDSLVFDSLSLAPERSRAVFGRATEAQRDFCRALGIPFRELLSDPVYLLQNSLATAEGAICEAISKTPRNLAGSAVLICGYGNCGKALARLFWLMDCEIFIFSREGSRRQAEADGYNTIELCSPRIAMFDLVLNTVPAPIFPRSVLRNLNPGTRFFQIATGSSGIDADFLAERGVYFYPLPKLPGIYSPFSEADAILDVLSDFLSESE